MFIEYPNSQYNDGIEIDCYGGEYSLVLANQANDGKVYKKWCFPQEVGTKGKPGGPIAKSLPWKIPLGDSAEAAVAMLEKLIDELRNQAGIPLSGTDGGEDVPF